jgi:hypothetical protein
MVWCSETRVVNGRNHVFYEVEFVLPNGKSETKEMKAIQCRPGVWPDPNPSPTVELMGVGPVQPPVLTEADSCAICPDVLSVGRAKGSFTTDSWLITPSSVFYMTGTIARRLWLVGGGDPKVIPNAFQAERLFRPSGLKRTLFSFSLGSQREALV